MNIEGTYTFAAPQEKVWPVLLDPEALARVLPGCEELKQVGENEFEGVLKIRIGPVQGTFNGTVTLSEIVAPESYHLSVSGKGAPGFVKGTGKLRLESANGETLMTYDGEAHVGGRIASVGQRLLDTSTKAIIRQSLEGMDKLIVAQATAQESGEKPEEIPAVEAPSQAQFTAGVIKNMLEEFIPPEQQQKLMSKAPLVIGILLLLLILDSWRMNRFARKIGAQLRKQLRSS